MTTAHCPHCSTPLDPTHAPVARIRGARVVTFCSIDCADADGRGEPPFERAQPRAAAAAKAAEPEREIRGAKRSVEVVQIDQSEASEPIAAPPIAGAKPAAAQVELADDAPLIVATKRSPALRKRRRQIIAALSIIFLGGMAIAIIEAVSPSKPSNADARVDDRPKPPPASAANAARVRKPEPKRAAAKPAAEPAARKIDPAVLYERALAELRRLMKSNSRRVRLQAAMALARIKDPEALKLLRRALDEEHSELVKIKIAYVLARAGNVDGQATLIGALRSKRLDVRLDGARSLIKLGDKRGREQLWGMISFASYRLETAALLARIGDKKGHDILTKALKDPYKPSNRTRAAVALGLAKDGSVRDTLRKMVKDRRYRVNAAHALAALGDKAAVPELVAHLDVPSLRLKAALALRRLGQRIALEPVAAGLVTGSDVLKATAAESIMILVGAAELAERD